MKYWSRKRIVRGSAPKPITRIGLELLAGVESHGVGWPKLMRIGRHDGDYDPCRYEVDIELAPGLILPMEFGLLDELPEGWDDRSHDEEDVVSSTEEGVEACLPQLDHLADHVHAARLKARSVVASWREHGLPARVVDVRLAPYDSWRGMGRPNLRILLETLGETLEPTIDTLQAWENGDVETLLAEARSSLMLRSARRDELMRQGATGAINQLALNAIGRFGDVSSTLRHFRDEQRIRLPDGTCIAASDGRIDAANSGEDEIVWHPESISVSTGVELQRDLATAVGRPVTELIDHHFLSPDMGVLKTEWSIDHTGDRRLTIDLAMPWRLFCSATGRVWDHSEAGSDTTNVVPFGKRWA